MTDRIHSEHDHGVALLTVDAPKSRNALTLDLPPNWPRRWRAPKPTRACTR